MEKWFIKNKSADYKIISKDFNISNIISKILVNRDIVDYDLINSFLNPDLNKLHRPEEMKDLIEGTRIIYENIKENKKIRIVGDYDVDGVMSIYILYNGIKKCGGQVDYVIPNRVDDGYGINIEIIKKAKEDGIDTILTCDNGIAAIEQIKLAKELGITIIVTDHHDVPFVLDEKGNRIEVKLEADAIINPKQEDCNYPFKSLCGAGIAFKFIEKLYLMCNISIDEIYYMLEYAAIATVCDVVDLVDENRIIVKNGLKIINKTRNIGLKALIKETGIEDKEIGIYHLGFIIGPSINASGRLDSALKALELLLCKDIEEANLLAKELRELNEERKFMTNEGVEKIIEKIELSDLKNHKVLVIYEPTIHESIAGIIAGRIKDRYNKPTIVLTEGKDGAKGSARSIEEYNIFEELSKCKDLLSKFGGHPMAAGLSLDINNIDKLRVQLNDNMELTDEDLIPRIYIDMQLPLEYISFKLIDDLKLLEPFGKGNSKPIFGEKGLNINRASILGKNKNVLKFILSKELKNIDAIYFGEISKFEEMVLSIHSREQLDKLYKGMDNNVKIDILYYPNINEYNGNTTIQLNIQSFRIS